LLVEKYFEMLNLINKNNCPRNCCILPSLITNKSRMVIQFSFIMIYWLSTSHRLACITYSVSMVTNIEDDYKSMLLLCMRLTMERLKTEALVCRNVDWYCSGCVSANFTLYFHSVSLLL